MEEGECSEMAQEGNAERKEERQSEMEEDPPITVAFAFPAVQSRREPTSPKRNLNLEPEIRRMIFAPTIFTKLFNEQKEREGRYSCAVRNVLHVVPNWHGS